MTSPALPPHDHATFWSLVIISLLCFAFYCAMQAWSAMHAARMTLEQRNRVEAQKLMLRFCTSPTKQNYDTAWDFITDNDVMLGDMDWPLVQRFTRTAVTAHFSTLEAR